MRLPDLLRRRETSRSSSAAPGGGPCSGHQGPPPALCAPLYCPAGDQAGGFPTRLTRARPHVYPKEHTMIDLTPIHFSGDDAKVVRVIQQHQRLSALLPAGIEPLVTAYVTAKATAAEVAKLKKADAPDFGALLDADLKAGRQPDAADLVKKYAAAQREAAEIRVVVAQLDALPARYHADVVREVQAAAETIPEALADDLDEILDRAAPLVADLDGINSADQALDARRGDAWLALKALTAEYAEVRDAQLALNRAEDSA